MLNIMQRHNRRFMARRFQVHTRCYQSNVRGIAYVLESNAHKNAFYEWPQSISQKVFSSKNGKINIYIAAKIRPKKFYVSPDPKKKFDHQMLPHEQLVAANSN